MKTLEFAFKSLAVSILFAFIFVALFLICNELMSMLHNWTIDILCALTIVSAGSAYRANKVKVPRKGRYLFTLFALFCSFIVLNSTVLILGVDEISENSLFRLVLSLSPIILMAVAIAMPWFVDEDVTFKKLCGFDR